MRGLANKPLLSVTGVANSAAASLDPCHRGDVTLCQIDIGGSGTYQIEGRLHPSANWVELLDADVTANALVAIASVGYIRLVGKSGSSGVANLYAQ